LASDGLLKIKTAIGAKVLGFWFSNSRLKIKQPWLAKSKGFFSEN
jgi:hypothetical protein